MWYCYCGRRRCLLLEAGRSGNCVWWLERHRCSGALYCFGLSNIHYSVLRVLRCHSGITLHDCYCKLELKTYIIHGWIIFLFFKCFQYSTFLMILLILQIILAIFVFVYIGDIQTAAAKVLDRLWEQKSSHVSFWDAIQNGVSRITHLVIVCVGENDTNFLRVYFFLKYTFLATIRLYLISVFRF